MVWRYWASTGCSNVRFLCWVTLVCHCSWDGADEPEAMETGFSGLADAGNPGVQTIFMALYAIFVTWRMMGRTTMPLCWLPDTAGFGLGATRRRLPTCRRLPNALGHPIWRFWWCRWWGHSLSISSTRW
ncbi:sodium/glutamate symporter [Shigella flexneri]